jgi:hypothetical protein
MKKFFKKHRVWIWSVIYAFLAGGFFYWGIFSLTGNIKMNLDKVQKKALDNEIKQAKIAKIPEIEKKLTQANENEKKLTGLLGKDQEVDFIKKLEALANETKNEIDLKINETSSLASKSPEKAEVKNVSGIKLLDHKYISFRATLKGDYYGLVNFMKKLENFEYFVNVLSFSSNLEKDNQVRTLDNPFLAKLEENNSAAGGQEKTKTFLKTQLDFIVYIQE